MPPRLPLRVFFGLSHVVSNMWSLTCGLSHVVSVTSPQVRCINFLGDSDSTGSICGQIAGAFYGYVINKEMRLEID